jgi:hypothetical protein
MPKYEVVAKGIVYCDPIAVEAESIEEAVKLAASGDYLPNLDDSSFDMMDPHEWLVYDETFSSTPQYAEDPETVKSVVKDRERYLGVITTEGFIRSAKLCDVYKDAEAFVIDYFTENGFDPAEDDGKVLVFPPGDKKTDPEEVYAVSALDDLVQVGMPDSSR